MTLFRSLLFAPGSDERKAIKALGGNADAIVLDLEDSVATTEKDKARSLVSSLLRQSSRQKVFVRINSLGTPFALEDLCQVIEGTPYGIMLPKAEVKREVQIVDWILDQLENKLGIPRGHTELIPLVESPAGIEHSLEIVSASARVKRLAFGALDYTVDLGTSYSRSGEEVFYARTRLVVASRTAGREGPIDTVFPDIKDIEGLEREVELVKRLGFTGKLAIHPCQIDSIHRAFFPGKAEIERARKIVEMYQGAMSNGLGVCLVDGKMVDAPVFMRAQAILEQAAMNGVR